MKKSTCGIFSLAGLSTLALLHITMVILDKSGSYSLHKHLTLDQTSSDVTATLEPECKVYYESIGGNVLEERSHQEKELSGDVNSKVKETASIAFKPLRQEDIKSVKNFIFFIGYARSGHSIVASLLDAHPDIVIAHEFNLFRAWMGKEGDKLSDQTYLYKKLHQNSQNNALKGWRSKQKQQKGYSLDTESPWQGTFRELLVIGDKSGAVTTQVYDKSPEKFGDILDRLKKTVGVPIKVLHVVRNPYDMISTRLLYADAHKTKSKLKATEHHKHCNVTGLYQQVNRTIALTGCVHEFLASTSLDVLDVHLVDLIEDPGHLLRMLCTYLSVECPGDYIRTCANKVYNGVSRTRDTVVWPEWLVEKVYLEVIKPFPSFWRYSFMGH